MEFIIKNWYLFAALVVVLLLLFYGPIMQKLHGIGSVFPAQAVQLINHQSAIVIDVGEPKEFKAGHIPNSINIPLGSLSGRTAELKKYKGKPVVMNCPRGNRSVKGALILRKQGFDSIYTLAGGLTAWQRDNMPVET